jgi:hypothetical protein
VTSSARRMLPPCTASSPSAATLVATTGIPWPTHPGF